MNSIQVGQVESAASTAGTGRRASVGRLTATGGIAAALIFVLCWTGTFVPFSSPTHAFIGLFTTAEMTSTTALIEGTFWSLLFGALWGAMIAVTYNLLAVLERPRT